MFSLWTSTYLANVYGQSFFQLMAFLSVLRIILPESTPAKKFLSPWVIRVLTILLPLVVHLPFYYLLNNPSQSVACYEQARNRITIHMRQEETFNKKIATYLTTADGLDQALEKQLNDMNLFPINLQKMVDENVAQNKLPSSTHDGIFNIRNSFNVFGHFFLWSGYLVVADMLVTLVFICYWIFVVRAYQTSPKLPKLADQMMAENEMYLASYSVSHIGEAAAVENVLD